MGMCLLEGGGGNFEEKAKGEMQNMGLMGADDELDECVARALK